MLIKRTHNVGRDMGLTLQAARVKRVGYGSTASEGGKRADQEKTEELHGGSV